jgi:hypothetical protein
VDGIGLELCLVVCFGINSVDHSCSATRDLVTVVIFKH